MLENIPQSNSEKVDFSYIKRTMGAKYEVAQSFFLGLDQYLTSQLETFPDNEGLLPPLYHGTRVSALTGIRLRGLIPVPEKNFPEHVAVYGSINPYGAAYHILTNSNFDTYQDKPINLKMDEDDPPVILKIDTQKYFDEVLQQDLIKAEYLKQHKLPREFWDASSIKHSIIQAKKAGLFSMSFIGTPISVKVIPPQYITVLATGILQRKDQIEEISLEEAYQRLLEAIQKDKN